MTFSRRTNKCELQESRQQHEKETRTTHSINACEDTARVDASRIANRHKNATYKLYTSQVHPSARRRLARIISRRRNACIDMGKKDMQPRRLQKSLARITSAAITEHHRRGTCVLLVLYCLDLPEHKIPTVRFEDRAKTAIRCLLNQAQSTI